MTIIPGTSLLPQRRIIPPPDRRLAARIAVAVREAGNPANRRRLLRIKTALSLIDAAEKFQIERARLWKPETALEVVYAARTLLSLGRREEAEGLTRSALMAALNDGEIYPASLVICEAAKIFIRLGNREEAERCILEARRLIISIERVDCEDEAWGALPIEEAVDVLIRLGWEVVAWAAIGRIFGIISRAKLDCRTEAPLLIKLTKCLVALKKYGEVAALHLPRLEALLQDSDFILDRPLFQCEAAKLHINIGQKEDALKLVNEIKEQAKSVHYSKRPNLLWRLYYELANIYLQLADEDMAANITPKIFALRTRASESPHNEALILAKSAEIYARLGMSRSVHYLISEIRRKIEAADYIPPLAAYLPHLQVKVLCRIAGLHQILEEDEQAADVLAEAFALADKINYFAEWRFSALREAGEALIN